MATEEIQEQLGGTWVLERSEHVDDYLRELGIGLCERQSIQNNTLKQTVSVIGDVIHLEMEVAKRHVHIEFKLGQEFEINQGICSKVTAGWQDGVLTLRIRRVHCPRLQVVERTREGHFMVQTMTSNNVTCRRYLKRLSHPT